MSNVVASESRSEVHVGKQSDLYKLLAKKGDQFDVKATVAAINEVAIADRQTGHDAAHKRIASALRFVLNLGASSKALAAFDAERVRHQVPPAQDGKNPHLPVVRTLEGWWAEPEEGEVSFEGVEGLRRWYSNPSNQDWAYVIAELISMGVDPDDAPSVIKRFKHKSGKAGIQGLVLAERDRRKPPKRERGDKWKKGQRDRALASNGLCVLDIPPQIMGKLKKHDGFCSVILAIDRGRAVLLCDALETEARIVKTVQTQEGQWKDAA